MGRFPHLVIRASAGTGKTFQLSNRYLGLAAAGAPAEQILSATFARKAAGEILDRVLHRLAEAVNDPSRRQALAEQIADPDFTGERCGELLQSLIQRLHRLRIGTLDSFFVQFAGSFGLELGLPPGWRICDEIRDLALRADAIQQILQSEETQNVIELMHLLNKGDLRRSITDQVFSVAQQLHALYVETDRDAWHGLKHRRELTTAELAAAIEEFEAFSDWPADQRFSNAHRKSVENARADDWSKFLSTGLAKAALSEPPTYGKKPLTASVIAAYRPLIDHAQAVLVNRIAHQTEASHRLLAKFDEAYQTLKRERRSLRFEDVTRSLCSGLSRLKTNDIAYRLDAHISHLLLDEFQDTSLSQWAVLRPIAEQVATASPDRSFFCVGDVKQAIYGWRGGVAAVFEAVTDTLSGLSQQPLNQSYRSSPPVIETVNQVFQSLEKAPFIAERTTLADAWRTRFLPHTTAKTEYGGYCRLMTAPRAPDGTPQTQTTLRAAAQLVAELHQNWPHRSIGILVRRNQAVARLSFELRERFQIDASEEGGNPLTDSAGVQLILSLLSVADHPGDTASRYLLANSPLAEEFRLTDWRSDRAAGAASARIRSELLDAGYGPTIYRWVSQLAPQFDARELKRMLQLVELAYRYEAQATLRAADFLRFVRSSKVEDPTSANVRIMTVHQSKGLQFDHVVLPELDGKFSGLTPMLVAGRDEPTGPIRRICRYASEDVVQLLPPAYQQMFHTASTERWNEALCVLYVALTRAIHGLHMVVAPSSPRENSLPATPAGLLRATLTDGALAVEEQTLFETGNPDWDAEAVHEAPTEVAAEPPLAATLAANPPIRIRGLPRQSPSGREGGGYVRLDRLLSEEANFAMARGTLFHKWFEQIGWLDEAEPAETLLLEAAAALPATGLKLKSELSTFQRMLKEPAVRAALSKSTYARGGSKAIWPKAIGERLAKGQAQLAVERERSFALREGGALLQGTLDRIVWCRENGQPLAADIIDFKTDAFDPDDKALLQELVDRYRPQIEAYRAAVAQISGLTPTRITARLLFVGRGIVIPID